ncbi:MAG: hypothetical protein ACREVQ_02345 [Burkholderiales bacterium]
MAPVKETAANAFKVSLEAGDLVVEFGRIGDAAPGGPGTVAVSDRIVLPLDTARRLVLSLGDSLGRHAAALRAAEAKALPPGEAAVAARPGQVAVRAPADEAGEKGALLLRLVGELDVPHQYERSFRISEAGLMANRYLLTIDRRDLLGDPRERLLAICERLGMPAALRSAAEQRFEMTSCAHFGFEGDPDSVVCKLYLERQVPDDEARRAREQGQPALLHLAFKWQIGGGTEVTSEYLWYPQLATAQIEARLASHVYRDRAQASLALAKEVLALAAAKVPVDQLQYLEVQEPGNGRKSFDLNLYNARLQVKDLQPVLYRMRDLFGVRPGQFQALYDQIKGKTMGHLAGGVHRNGKDFFNLYYGVAGFPLFNERLRQSR